MKYFLIGLLLFSACALPQPEQIDQSFVPEVELQGASLVKEGMYYYRKSRFFEAEASLRKALYLFPEAENVKASLAVVLKASGQQEESIEIFKGLIERNPDVVEYQLGIARVYYAVGKYFQALQWYEKSYLRDLNADDFAAAAALARSLSSLKFRIGEEVDALCYSEESFRLRKNTEELLRHVKTLLALGYYETAREWIVDWMQSQDLMKDPRLLQKLSMVLYGLGEVQESLRFAELASDIGVTDGTRKFELTVLEKITDDGSARSEFDDDEFESLAEQDLQFKEQLVQALQNPMTLYWTLPFLEGASALAGDEVEIGDEVELVGEVVGRSN